MYFSKEICEPSSPCSEPDNESDDLFRSKVKVLWQEECFVDVTLACEDKLLTAHKLVLSAYSDYFKAMFSSLQLYQYPIIFMKDVSYEILQALLQFMYCGEVNVAQYNLNAFMKMANTLKIKGLTMDENIPIPVQQQLSGKRKRQSPATVQQMRSSPLKKTRSTPNKRPRVPMQFQHNDFEEDYEEEEQDEEQEEEEETLMMPKHSMNRNSQQMRPQSMAALRHSDTNVQRERNNSYSSQQSKTSLSKPPSLKSRLQQSPLFKLGRDNGSRDNLNVKAVSEPGYSDSENVDNSNIMETSMELPDLDGSFSRSSQRSGPRVKPRVSSESVGEKQSAKANSVQPKPQPRSSKPLRGYQKSLFSNEEHEERLSKFVDYMTQISPLTSNQVKAFAWSLDSVSGKKDFGNNGPSEKWWRNFVRKRNDINFREYEFVKDSALSPEMFSCKGLGSYLIPLQEIIEAFNLSKTPENCWSCTEYTLNVNSDSKDCLHPSRERYFDPTHFPAEGDFVSVMLAGSASGKKIAPFSVFKNRVPDNYHIQRGPINGMYDHNSTGFLDSALLMKWFKDCFLPQCPKSRTDEIPIVLVMNSNLPLVPPEMFDLAATENVILLSLTPHVHSSCQPMDYPFVRGFREIFREAIKSIGVAGQKMKDAFPFLLKNSFDKGITAELITTGFRICGLFPLTVNVSQINYMILRTELGFHKTLETFLDKERAENESEKLKTQGRKSKVLPPQSPSGDMNTSDEEELEEYTNTCYVCDKEFPKEGVKEDEEKWTKCGKRYCKNYSCQECLPLNFDKMSEYICIDCNR